MSAPVFVVVGHVNRGKSSIVSTLAADDSVRIDSMPGTTRQCREFPMRVGEQTLYTLVDTPGFERPRQALAWLKEHETSTAERRQTVQEFLRQHERSDTFEQECELLRPILDGAAILYVVDGSKPPSPKYEAEMEVLRWTAQPRVALINSTGRDDYSAEWRTVLDQYFNMVRSFNAHQADFRQRIRLLKMLREMSDATRGPLDRAIACLQEDREASLHEAAEAIAAMLVEVITYVEEKRLAAEADPADHHEALAERYYEHLRRTERVCRNRLRQIFLHHQLEIFENKLSVVEDDLFNLDTWNRLGLSRTQLTAAGAAAGAVAGGAIDAAVGGASFLLGMVVGGAAGGAASWYAAGKLPEVKIYGVRLGGQLMKIGPMKNPSFPWVALDRALMYLDVVADRAHARREAVELKGDASPEGIVTGLPSATRKSIERCFQWLRRQPGGETVDKIASDLGDEVEGVLRKRHRLEGTSE